MSSSLYILWKTQGCKWYEWFFIMSLELWMTSTTPIRELNVLDNMNSLELWLTWTTLGCALKINMPWINQGTILHELLQVMSLRHLMLWTTHLCVWYERLRILWAEGSRCYERLKVVVDMNDSESWGIGSRFYEQLRFVDDMNDSWSWA